MARHVSHFHIAGLIQHQRDYNNYVQFSNTERRLQKKQSSPKTKQRRITERLKTKLETECLTEKFDPWVLPEPPAYRRNDPSRGDTVIPISRPKPV